MSVDAVMLLRPTDGARLRAALGPDVHFRVLPDGAVLVHSLFGYAAVERDVDEGRAILSGYDPAVAALHDDRRGILFFPDVAEPRGVTYEAVVAEIGAAGVWVPARRLTRAERKARAASVLALLDAFRLPKLNERLMEQGLPAALVDEMVRTVSLVVGAGVDSLEPPLTLHERMSGAWAHRAIPWRPESDARIARLRVALAPHLGGQDAADAVLKEMAEAHVADAATQARMRGAG